jgi:1-acyl-sn-glycerol-3-phosphate acyltransferase
MFNPFCMRTMAFARTLLKPLVDHLIKISVSGIENIPRRGPFVLVSNHRSDLDPVIIASVVPRYVAWIADAFLFNIPFISNVLRQLGVIPISGQRREQLKAFRRSREILNAGQPVGIFPEGHDSIVHGSGLKLGRFHSGFAELAVKNHTPVLPVTVIPLEEAIQPLEIPSFIKDGLRLPDDVALTQQRVVYSRVHVEIGKRIDTSAYSGGLCGKAYKADVSGLVSRTRVAIGETLYRAIG